MGWLVVVARGMVGEGVREDTEDVEMVKGAPGPHSPSRNGESCPEWCGGVPAGGCGGDCGLEGVNSERRNAFRARTRRLESSEVPVGLTGLEKFRCFGKVEGVRPAMEREPAIGLDRTSPGP